MKDERNWVSNSIQVPMLSYKVKATDYQTLYKYLCFLIQDKSNWLSNSIQVFMLSYKIKATEYQTLYKYLYFHIR